ncbi:MAG: TrbI/VirB10 family protein [Gammaproteobacteria bacterium]
MTAVLALGFISLFALGLLAWYYTHEWSRTRGARERAATASQQRAQGEMKLPPLQIQPPKVPPRFNAAPVKSNGLWGAPPPPPSAPAGPAYPTAYRPGGASAAPAAPPVDRRLTGPVLSEDESSVSVRSAGTTVAAEGMPSMNGASPVLGTSPAMPTAGANGGSALGDMLRPTTTPATFARALPTQRMLLPQGWKIDCTLETAIDSSLQGFVTCVTPVDIFGADGTTVLLERGTQLFGETRGEARQGLARVFVLWTRARTPGGVVAMLDSPGTDDLGRAGLPGRVQRHFSERFGAALLISVIEGAIQRATRPSDGGTVILNPNTIESMATEALKSTVNIPPTVLKDNGDRIQIVVARDIDFRSVYELRPAADR